MVLQAFADDSTTDRGNFVLAGYLATAEEWVKFSLEWEPLAKAWGVQQRDGGYTFHMTEMAALDERKERVPAFYRVIENHKLSGFAFGLNKASYARAIGRISVKNHNVNMKLLTNPFNMLFFFLGFEPHTSRYETPRHV